MATRAQAIAEAEKGKSRSAAASGETKKNAFDKKAGRVSATKAGRVDPKSGMESDVYYAFAFTGFPGGTDEIEAVNLMKEYANDFLGDFNVQVAGSNAAKGQIALTFLASEGEALAANVHAQRDKFVYRGHTLSTMAVDTLEIAAFKFPEAPPVHAAPASASGVHAAAAPAQTPVPVPRVPSGPSPLFSSPNRRLVQTVFESTPPGLPAAPVLPGDVSSDDKLDKVLTSLASLTTFIRTEVVTRTHLDRFHQEQIQAIENRVEQAVEPLTTEIKVLKERVVALEAHHIGSGARGRRASERPRATDPAFKTIVFKGIPEIMAAEARLSEIEAFVKMHFPQVRVRDVGNFYKGPFPNGRSLTRAAYVELSRPP